MRPFALKNLLLCLVLSASLASADSQVTVGAILTLSGPGSLNGRELRQGMELCADDVKILFEDSQGKPAIGLTAFKKLVDLNKINLAIVSFSGVAGAIIPAAASSGVPLILTIVSSRSVTRDAKGEVLRFFTSGEQEAPIAARYLSQVRKLTKAAVLHLEDEYGMSYQKAFSDEFEANGGRVVLSQTFSRETFDFRTALTLVKSSGADVIYLIGYDEHMLSAIRQAKDLGVSAVVAGNWILTSPAILKENKDLLQGVILTAPTFYLESSPRRAEFKIKFHTRYGTEASAYSALGCDTMHLVRVRMQGAKLNDAWNVDGVLGNLTAAPDGSVEIPLRPAIIQDGHVQALNSPDWVPVSTR